MSNVRWVHFLPDGSEINYDTEPTDVPTLRVEVTKRGRGYVVEETATWLIRPTANAFPMWVPPRGKGWQYKEVSDYSAHWTRKVPA